MRLLTNLEDTNDYIQTSVRQSELTIRTMVNMLSKYVSEAQDDWDDFINHISLAYNSTVNESTGFTPYFMAHGREVRLPIDIMVGTSPEDQPVTPCQYASKLKDELTQAYQLARNNLKLCSSDSEANL